MMAHTPELEVGAEAWVDTVVSPADLASALVFGEGDSYLDVYSTPRMVGLLEVAAARLLAPLLRDGETSVGVEISVRHLAPTPVGMRVRGRAIYTGREGQAYRFEIEAYDVAGEIGRGVHLRAIVEGARLRARALKRQEPY
jgi:fluoroacetyl-CoA thioesterase